jgi:hypothetical protein
VRPSGVRKIGFSAMRYYLSLIKNQLDTAYTRFDDDVQLGRIIVEFRFLRKHAIMAKTILTGFAESAVRKNTCEILAYSAR